MPRDNSPVLPSSVDVYFRAKQCYCPPASPTPPGGGPSPVPPVTPAAIGPAAVNFPVPNFYVSRRPIADYFPAVGNLPAVAGHPGAKIFHDTPYALWTADAPDPANKAELDAIAARVAKDYYGWQDFSYDRVYNKLVDFVAGGPPYGGTKSQSELESNTDTITWSYRPGYAATRIACGPYNGTPEELSHATNEDCCDRRNVAVLAPLAGDQGVGGFVGFHSPTAFLSIDREALASCPCLDETCDRTICLHFHKADTGSPVNNVQIIDVGYIDLGGRTHSLGSGVASRGEFCFLAQPVAVLVSGYYVRVSFDAAWGAPCTVQEQFGLGFDPFPCGSTKDVHFSLCSYEYCFTGLPAGASILADYGCPEKFGDGTPHQPDWAKCHDHGCPNLCSTRVGDCFRVGGIGGWPQPASEACTYPLIGNWQVSKDEYLDDCGPLPPVACGDRVTIATSLFPLTDRKRPCCPEVCTPGIPPPPPITRSWKNTLHVVFRGGDPTVGGGAGIGICHYFGSNEGVPIEVNWIAPGVWYGRASEDGSLYLCRYLTPPFPFPDCDVEKKFDHVDIYVRCCPLPFLPPDARGAVSITYQRVAEVPACPDDLSPPGCGHVTLVDNPCCCTLDVCNTDPPGSPVAVDAFAFSLLHDPCGPAMFTANGQAGPFSGHRFTVDVFE